MIYLHEDKNYFILVDGQTSGFAGYCLFESIEEVIETFQGWANTDGYENPKLTGWSIGDCLSNWTFELKYYNGTDFVEAPEQFINHIIK